MGQFDDFINRYFDPGFAAPATSYGVRCWLATNQDGGAVSYVNDVLGYQPGGDAYPVPFATGEVHQLFNDRTSEHPFDPDSADRTIITLKPMRCRSSRFGSAAQARKLTTSCAICWTFVGAPSAYLT